jgi:hypothetical protein
MKQILVELDLETVARLERIAPARSRKRSQFIRDAIRRAIWEQEEAQTREAYLETPDTPTEPWPEPPWEPWTEASKKSRPRSGK